MNSVCIIYRFYPHVRTSMIAVQALSYWALRGPEVISVAGVKRHER